MWSCDGVGASGDSQGHARPQDSGGADAWRWELLVWGADKNGSVSKQAAHPLAPSPFPP